MVIVADLTKTRFCDSAGLQYLLHARKQAARSGTQLRLAIAADGPIARLIELTGISRHVPVYPTLQQAAHGGPPPG